MNKLKNKAKKGGLGGRFKNRTVVCELSLHCVQSCCCVSVWMSEARG